MRTMRLSLLTAVALALLVTVTTQALATDNQIEGVWDVVVTIISCTSGEPIPGIAQFPGTIMFTRHGQVIETAGTPNVGPPLPQQRLMPGLGTWQRLGRRHFSAAFTFFRVNVPSNTFAGTQTITEDIELSHDGNEFTTTGTSTIVLADGTTPPVGCNALTGTRRD
jgi:hypothetical protein